MVTDPKEMVASNCPWPFVKKKEIICDYSHGPKKKKSTINISVNIGIICNLFSLFLKFFPQWYYSSSSAWRKSIT